MNQATLAGMSVPASVGFLGTGFVVALAPNVMLLWALLPALAGMVAGYAMRGAIERAIHHARNTAAAEAMAQQPPPATHVEGLDALCGQVLPIWSRQIQSVRGQTEGAVTDLTQCFSISMTAWARP